MIQIRCFGVECLRFCSTRCRRNIHWVTQAGSARLPPPLEGLQRRRTGRHRPAQVTPGRRYRLQVSADRTAGPQPHAAHGGLRGSACPRRVPSRSRGPRSGLSPPGTQPDGGTCCYGRCSGRTTPTPGRSSVGRSTADTAAAPPHRLPPRRPRPPPPLPRLGSCLRRTVRGAHGRTNRTCA